MRPDYPFKYFFDQRNKYAFLIQSLATDSSR